ncbi:MAG: ATP-binding protein [Woeseiaceae bacterium]
MSDLLKAASSFDVTELALDQRSITERDEFNSECMLVFLSDIATTEADAISAYSAAIAPTPMLLVADGIASMESSFMATGVEDCLDTLVMSPEAILRATQRCIDRAVQRVHVSTAERRYQDLFDSMPVAAFRTNSERQIVIANRAFLRLMNAEKDVEITDIELNGLLTGLSALQRSIPDNTPEYKDQHIFDTFDGEQKHVVVSARAGRTNDDEPIMDVFVTDVTEQEEQTRRVVKAENRLRDLYDNVPVMMFELDREFQIQQPNRTMVSDLGYAEELLVGKALASFLHDQTDSADIDRSVSVLAAGKADVNRPLILKNARGDVIECLYTVKPVFHDSVGLAGGHAMLVDVTAQNQAQRERDELHEQLQLTQKLESIGELAAGIAHEINTPAQYVSDNLSFLMESFDDLFAVLNLLPDTVTKLQSLSGGNEHAEALGKAIETADVEYLTEEIPSALNQGHDGIGKIREIVLALKDFSHPGSGTMEASDLNRIIESTVTVARNEWKYIANMDFQLDETLPAVHCFPSAISQVVLNIVVNAAHAIGDAREDGSDAMGQISIATSMVDDETVLVRIRDDGPGIPEDVRHKIFDPFFTTKEVGRGTGQGLAISRSVITEQHGGSIGVETATGKGTEFKIELPLKGKVAQSLSEEAA